MAAPGHERTSETARRPAAGAGRAAAASSPAPLLSLTSQTPWVTADEPWFNIGLGVGEPASEAASLHVSLTFYSRIDDGSQFQQALGSTPQKSVLGRVPDVAVEDVDGRLVASACLTVVPDADATPPASGQGACAGGGTTLVLGCTPLMGTCGDVYPGLGRAPPSGHHRRPVHHVPHLSRTQRRRERAGHCGWRWSYRWARAASRPWPPRWPTTAPSRPRSP